MTRGHQLAPEQAGTRRDAARGFVVAGTHSGVGKTSLALGLMGALRRRGYPVAPFKVGPDYIDPTYHTLVSGVPSRNLDTWLMPPEELPEVMADGVSSSIAPTVPAAAAVGASAPAAVPGPRDAEPPVAVVEGVMGLFDGRVGGGEECSTAHVAKLLGLPVVLVVDCSSMARSVAAVVHGYSTFDPDLAIAGVILNKVAGGSHERMIRDALGDDHRIVGVVPRRSDLRLESRHLGLIPTVEDADIGAVLEAVIDHVEAHVDLDALIDLSEPPTAVAQSASQPAGERPRSDRRVAVARDRAFSFYYQDNLDLLQREGATVIPFSPADGEPLPDCDALYLGGGYPEIYASELAANDDLRRDLFRATDEGLPIYAECGGYLYLGEEIEYEGVRHAMAGVIPTRTSLGGGGRLRMGYVEAGAAEAHPLEPTNFRGHLFHYSRTEGSVHPAYRVRHRGDEFPDGFAAGNLVASYLHLHFRGSRALARWLAGTLPEEEPT